VLNFRGKLLGPALVAVAGLLWATDALMRYPAAEKLDPVYLVFLEHILAIIAVLPFIIRKYGKSTFGLSRGEFFCAALSGIGGSALATTFFTASMTFVNPSVSVLLQKMQPVMVVVIAHFFLGERPQNKFYFWSIIALGAGIVLSFPDMDFDFIGKVSLRSTGIQYALAAAFLWAASTVSGKSLLNRTPPLLATFWRFVFGLIALMVIMHFSETFLQQPGIVRPGFGALLEGNTPYFLLYLSLVPGLIAFLFYYSGLAKTPASVATFILNTTFLHTPLSLVQVIAGIILMLSVTAISL
jgi:drug/metabolite transporter (DMT)-like permease